MPNAHETDVVYLDNAAATRCDPRVVDVLVRHHLEEYGNAGATSHGFGREAADAVESARGHVRRLVAASLGDEAAVVFTSGATEANNLFLSGLAARAGRKRRRIVTTVVEHKSVLAPLDALRAQGFDVVRCGVDGDGRIDLDELRELVDERTLLVSVQAANNELGTLQPVDRIADIAHAAGAFVHCDAAQAAGKVPIDMGVLDLDAVSLSGGKFHGPKGTGALVVRAELLERIDARQLGGGQEGGMRSGTHDVPGISGLGEAARIASVGIEGELRRIGHLRLLLEDTLLAALPGARVNAATTQRVPGILSLVLPSASAAMVLGRATDVAAGTGSACSAGVPSYVLQAIGLDPTEIARTVRFGLGRFTTEQDVLRAARSIIDAVRGVERGALATTAH